MSHKRLETVRNAPERYSRSWLLDRFAEIIRRLNNAIIIDEQTSHGDVVFFNGTDWTILPAGTDGDQLTTHGPGFDPTWEAAGTGGGGGLTHPQVLARGLGA